MHSYSYRDLRIDARMHSRTRAYIRTRERPLGIGGSGGSPQTNRVGERMRHTPRRARRRRTKARRFGKRP